MRPASTEVAELGWKAGIEHFGLHRAGFGHAPLCSFGRLGHRRAMTGYMRDMHGIVDFAKDRFSRSPDVAHLAMRLGGNVEFGGSYEIMHNFQAHYSSAQV